MSIYNKIMKLKKIEKDRDSETERERDGKTKRLRAKYILHPN